MPKPKLIYQVEAILSEARNQHLPEHWASDLVIDQAILEAEKPDRFVWQLYECGTNLYSLRTDNTGSHTVWKSFPFCLYYMYQRDPRRMWYTFDLHRSPALVAVTPHQWFAFLIWAVHGGTWGGRDIDVRSMPAMPTYGMNQAQCDNAVAQLLRLRPDYEDVAHERREWLRANGCPPPLRASPAMLAAGPNARPEYV